MIIYVTALKIEAEPVIGHYRLKKDMSIHAFPVYRSESVVLIISGVGKMRAAMAVSFLFGHEHFTATETLVVNIGFAGTLEPSLAIGDLVLAGKVTDEETGNDYYPDLPRGTDIPVVQVRCHGQRVYHDAVSQANNQSIHLPVVFDMESAGLMESSARFLASDRILIMKIISDTLDTGRLDPDQLRVLLASQLMPCEDLVRGIQKMHQTLANPSFQTDSQQVDLAANAMRLSESQKNQLLHDVRRHRLSGKDPAPDLARLQLKTFSKQERTEALEKLRTKWFNR